MFGMNYLWKYICTDKEHRGARKFVAVYTGLCVLMAFVFCVIIGMFTSFNMSWLEITMIITGYTGIGLGFFGSIIYAYRQ